jgi:hypothetical protein
MTEKTAFEALMEVVCPGWGFCGTIKDGRPLHVTDFIPERGLVTADQFVTWVFLGDGMNPEAQSHRWQRHKDAIKAAFIEHMGSEVVDASLLRWPGKDYNRTRDVLIINTDGSRRLRIVRDAGGWRWLEEIFNRLPSENRRLRGEWLDHGAQGGPFAGADLAEADARLKLDWLRNNQLFNRSRQVLYGKLK